MKKVFLTIVLSVFLLSGINAQKKSTAIFLHHESVMNTLNLDADQRAKIMDIKKITDPKLREIKANTSLSPEEATKKMREVWAERTKLQNEVLSADQLKKLKQMRAEAKQAN
ncbi:hypothetical protein [Pseudopedobacter beijingensis]|uniref:LTXXQ motif family protein n=1 Tax=Pseudopedobacter beijingensis TaxID=1207056 RepID=A0ABW4IID6_9SPHI